MANGSIILPPIQNLNPSEIKKIGFSEDISLFSNPDHGRLFAIEIHLTDSAIASTGYKLFQCVVCKNKIQMFGQKADSSWTTFGTIT